MGLQAQSVAAVLVRSDGPTFDHTIRDKDMAGAVFTGITPMDLGVFSQMRLARPRGLRGEPECVRGTGTSGPRERSRTT